MEQKGGWIEVEWESGTVLMKRNNDDRETDRVEILFFYGEWVWMNRKVVILIWLKLSF
jgi:hypothetical protein